MNRELLTRPFPAELIKQRPGRSGQTLNYVETHAVIARLNEGCDAWSFEVVSHEVQEGECIVLGRLTADGVMKCAFGGSEVTLDKSGRVVSIADDLKAAASDALKKAASLLGVGLELYGGVPATAVQAEAPQQQGRTNVQVGDRVTSRQLAAIHAVCRRNGIGRERLVEVLDERFDRSRPEQLSKREASELIDALSTTAGGNGAHA